MKIINFLQNAIIWAIIFAVVDYCGFIKEACLVLFGSFITYFAWGLILNLTPIGAYFKQQRAQIARPSFERHHIYAGMMVYFFCALGLVIFVLPIVNNFTDALCYGFLFALVVEGVFGFANYAWVNHYSAKLLLTGMLFGCIITSSMSFLMFWLKQIYIINLK